MFIYFEMHYAIAFKDKKKMHSYNKCMHEGNLTLRLI